MVGGRAARSGPRGGASISTPRPTRFRLTAGLLAFAVGLAIAGLSLDPRSGGLVFVSGTFAVLALSVLAASLLSANAGLVGPGVGALELVYLVHVLVGGQSTLVTVAIVGVMGLLAGELAQWSLDSRFAGETDWRVHLGRATAIAGLTLLSAAAAVIVLLAAAAPVITGGWTVALAVASSVGIIALASLAAARGVAAGVDDTEGPHPRHDGVRPL